MGAVAGLEPCLLMAEYLAEGDDDVDEYDSVGSPSRLRRKGAFHRARGEADSRSSGGDGGVSRRRTSSGTSPTYPRSRIRTCPGSLPANFTVAGAV